AVPIAAEPIGRPLRGWRKVEFVIGGGRWITDESLKTRVLPKSVAAHGSAHRRYAQIAQRPREDVLQHMIAGTGNRHFDFVVDRRLAPRIGMKFQCPAHAGIVAIMPHSIATIPQYSASRGLWLTSRAIKTEICRAPDAFRG